MRITVGQLRRIIRETVESMLDTAPAAVAPPVPPAPRNGESKLSPDGKKAYVRDQYGNTTVYDLLDNRWVKNRYESSDYQSPEHSMHRVVGRGAGWR